MVRFSGRFSEKGGGSSLNDLEGIVDSVTDSEFDIPIVDSKQPKLGCYDWALVVAILSLLQFLDNLILI